METENIKFAFTKGDQEIKFWVDNLSGSMMVDTADGVIEIPHLSAIELNAIIKRKLVIYSEEVNKRKSFFNRIFNNENHEY